MKISELSTENALDILCEITPHINAICSDEDLTAELKSKVKAEDVHSKAAMVALGVEKLNKIIPIVFKKRRDDVIAILAALNGQSVEAIKQQNALKTAMQIREIAKDKALIDFFYSCTDSEGRE